MVTVIIIIANAFVVLLTVLIVFGLFSRMRFIERLHRLNMQRLVRRLSESAGRGDVHCSQCGSSFKAGKHCLKCGTSSV